MKILMCIPSNKPDLLYKMHQSMKEHLGDVMESIDLKLALNGEAYGHSANSVFTNNLYTLRKDMIDFSYDYIWLADDDLEFQEGAEEYYRDVLHVLGFMKPGVLQVFGSRYPDVFQTDPSNCIMTTNRGLFIQAQALKGLPDIDIKGCCQDAIMGYHALETNPLHLVIGQAPVTRTGVKHIEENHESETHDRGIYEANARSYIRGRYDDLNWEVLTGEFPKGLRR